jgi:hypothetical protein
LLAKLGRSVLRPYWAVVKSGHGNAAPLRGGRLGGDVAAEA